MRCRHNLQQLALQGSRAAGPALLAATHAAGLHGCRAGRACSSSRCRAAGPQGQHSLQQFTLQGCMAAGPAQLAATHAAGLQGRRASIACSNSRCRAA
eukprot:7189390-Heterocapsa_arctica.AAC.1